jgi:hypothetical protein
MLEEKKLLYISYYFAPQNKIGAVRPTKQVKYLMKKGWKVTVITSLPDKNENTGSNNQYSGIDKAEIIRVSKGALSRITHALLRLVSKTRETQKSSIQNTKNTPEPHNNVQVRKLPSITEIVNYIDSISWSHQAKKAIRKRLKGRKYDIIVSTYEYSAGKRLNSNVLVSDAIQTRTDIFISLSVIVSLFLIKFGFSITIDPIITIIISGLIFYSAIEIIKPSANVLLDNTALDSEIVKSIVMELEEVKDCHNIRSRGRIDDIFLDLHIKVDPDTTVAKAHKLSHHIGRKIRETLHKNIEVIVHVEPYHEINE